MKKEIIFILSLIFMVNSVYALSFDDLNGPYSLADTLIVFGSSNESGFLFLTLKCGDYSSIIGGGEIYVENRFSEEINLEKEGECKVVADFDGETFESGTFLVGTSAVENTSAEETVAEPAAEKAVEQTILISARLNEVNYKPGDKLVVNGIADKSSTIVAEIDGKQFVTTGEEFKFSYELPKNIKSGKHEILVEAKDDSGNFGSMVLNFNVEVIPVDLTVSLNKQYNPGEQVKLLVSLYDQANEPASGYYNVVIYDGWSRVLENKYLLNEESILNLPEFASPGIRKVRVSAFGLTNSAEFLVNEVKKLDISLNGDVLSVKNTGNVPFSEELVINGYDLSKSKKLYLEMGESKEIDLSSLFEEGIYDISIPLTGQSFIGVNIDKGNIVDNTKEGLSSITGGVVYNVKGGANKYGYIFLISLILIVVGLIFLNRNTRFNLKKRAREKEFIEGQKRARQLRSEIRPYKKYSFGKASDEDVNYFKRKVVSDYGNMNKRDDSYNSRKKEDMPKGLFSMFR